MPATFATREQTTPTVDAAFGIDQIKRNAHDAGSHFFDADTLRFFGSKILPTVVGGRFFVTSEQRGFTDYARGYTVREMMPDGTIETVGEFLAYDSSRAANAAMRAAAKERHAYYFEGQHGRSGRRATYVVVDAVDPWAAMDRLHSNFRVFNCGRAYDWMLTDTHNYTHLTAR